MPIVQSSNGRVDVAIVGAGAAGIAAGKRLMARPDLAVLMIEAGRSIGGRARTRTVLGGVPIDLGCGWLHSALTNAWMHLAQPQGFTVDRTPAPWNTGELDFGISAADQDDYERSEAEFAQRIAGVAARGQDRALGDLLEPGHRWRGLLDAVSTYVNGAELDHVSAIDHERYRPGEGPDWRVVEGYGSLVAAYGASVPVALETTVTRIDHSGATDIHIDTTRGRIGARAVVITASTDVLAGGAIAFDPALPATIEAAADLPLGVADKLFLRLDDARDIPPEHYRLGAFDRAATGAYHLRPFGRPVIECFYGGALARHLERGGEAAFLAFAREELSGLFGSTFAGRLSPLAATAWAREPHILGSYSYAKPGRADSRAVLAAPASERLFFAGEATSPDRFTTAHGAYESGIIAADAVLTALGTGKVCSRNKVCPPAT